MAVGTHQTTSGFAEKSSAIILVLVALAVLVGLIRLVIDHWTYAFLIVVLAVGAKYLWESIKQN